MKSLIVLLILFLFLIIRPIHGEAKILINEFLIDPQPQQVELINIGSDSADVSGWYLDDSGGTTYYTIPQSSVIYPNSCLVFSGDFNLNKTSADSLRLFNNLFSPTSSSPQLIDSFSYKSSSGSGISYLRIPDGENLWSTSTANLGLFNSTMTSCLITPTIIITQSPTLTTAPALIPEVGLNSTVTPQPTPTIYSEIYINEVMVSPESGDKEWIEIYNNNDFDVFLVDWFIDDLENAGSSPKVFFLEIGAKSYGVFDLPSSIFNNDGDTTRLLDFNKNLKDDFEYSKSEQGKTLGRTSFESDDFCLQEPSKNSTNNPCINPTPTLITPSPTEKIIFPLITKNIPSDIPAAKNNNFDVSIHRSVNYPIGIAQGNLNKNNILGVTDKTIINSSSNKSLIDRLCFLSFFYSLLAIVSILIKSKILKYIKYDVILA